MWRTSRRSRVALAVLALVLLVAHTACGTKKSGSDQQDMDTIAQQIEATLAQRPDVVKARVNYQNSLDASARGVHRRHGGQRRRHGNGRR